MILHLVMIIVGLIMVGFAFWAIHYRSRFLKNLGGFFAPLGLLIAILGALLLAVPNFFLSFKNMIAVFFKSNY